MPQTNDSITRDQAIDLLRTAIRGMTDEETSMCKLAAERNIFCHGFAHFDDEELRQCFDWIVRKQPARSRAELEETANLWQLARQEVLGHPCACDVQQREGDLCKGWDNFSDQRLVSFYQELTGKTISIA